MSKSPLLKTYLPLETRQSEFFSISHTPVQIHKKIIHLDMDCFFAAVEMRDFPYLKDLPLAIGGHSDRGVLCTANYKAREYGVGSAMPNHMAKKLCPDLIIKPIREEVIKEAAKNIRDIFYQFTDLVQPLSVDEAFLDVTDNKDFQGSATLIAQEIKKQILKKTQLTSSAGVAPNKFLAKVASDWQKPNGLTVIAPGQAYDFAKNLELSKIPGVGPVSLSKLNNLGLYYGKDILQKGISFMICHFGDWGRTLWELSQGIDNRPVCNHSQRKSLGHESTFGQDLTSLRDCQFEMPRIISAWLTDLHQYFLKKGKRPIRTLTVKVKFNNFKSVSCDKTLPSHFFDRIWDSFEMDEELLQLTHELLAEAYSRFQLPVRLLGIGVRFVDEETNDSQLQLI